MQHVRLLIRAVRQEYKVQAQEVAVKPQTVGEAVAMLNYEVADLTKLWATSQSEYFALRKILRILTLLAVTMLQQTKPEDLIYHR